MGNNHGGNRGSIAPVVLQEPQSDTKRIMKSPKQPLFLKRREIVAADQKVSYSSSFSQSSMSQITISSLHEFNETAKFCEVKVRTWQRNSHGLYDYEISHYSSELLNATFLAQQSFYVKRDEKENLVSFENYTSLQGLDYDPNTEDMIGCVYFYNNNYWFYHDNHIDKNFVKDPSFKPWQPLPTLYKPQSNGYRVCEGDIVKFGRVRFKIAKIKGLKPQPPSLTRRGHAQSKESLLNSAASAAEINGVNQLTDVHSQNSRNGNNRRPQSPIFIEAQGEDLATLNNEHQQEGQEQDQGFNPQATQAIHTNLLLNDQNNQNIDDNQSEFALQVQPELTKRSYATSNKMAMDKSTQNPCCRICLGDEDEPDNPMITPCACSGSVRFIHYECLKQWLDQKKQKRHGIQVLTYAWKNMTCELCKQMFPWIYYHPKTGKDYDLLQYETWDTLEGSTSKKDKKETKWVILESVTLQQIKIIHIIRKNEKPVFVGRGLDSGVRVTDISVSRQHAKIHWDEAGYCCIKDLESKFGTCIMVQEPIQIHQNTQSFQIGRSILEFRILQSQNCRTCWKWLLGKDKPELIAYPAEFDEEIPDIRTESYESLVPKDKASSVSINNRDRPNLNSADNIINIQDNNSPQQQDLSITYQYNDPQQIQRLNWEIQSAGITENLLINHWLGLVSSNRATEQQLMSYIASLDQERIAWLEDVARNLPVYQNSEQIDQQLYGFLQNQLGEALTISLNQLEPEQPQQNQEQQQEQQQSYNGDQNDVGNNENDNTVIVRNAVQSISQDQE